jgi:ATP-independent RNA helicase DbpA
MNIQPTLFADLAISPQLLSALASLELTAMTEVQSLALGPVLQGLDVRAQSKTGSGKTLAFALGVLDQIVTTAGGGVGSAFAWPKALVLCPTRELSEQVAEEFRRLGRFIPNLRVVTLCGGVPGAWQRERLQSGAHVIVGTPGRVLERLTNNEIGFAELKTLVFDEADRLLDMGFVESIRAIVTALPKTRQTLFFSATYPDEVEQLSREYQKKAVAIATDALVNAELMKETYVQSESSSRDEDLKAMLKIKDPGSALVFCATKSNCSSLALTLMDAGFSVLTLHGDLDQRQRTEVLARFKNKSVRILVATDVAARGLDIKELSLVVNYDLARDPEVHVHRIGRTGRAEASGEVWSFFSQKQRPHIDETARKFSRPFSITTVKGFMECLSMEHTQKASHPAVASRSVPSGAPMLTVSISGGRKSKVRKADILGSLTKEVGFSFSDIGVIDVFDTYSFVALARHKVAAHFGRLTASKIKGIKYKISVTDSTVAEMLDSVKDRNHRYARSPV